MKQSRSSKVRVLLVDDHPIVRRGLSDVVSREPDLEVCGEAGSEGEAIRIARKSAPSLAIVDLALEKGHGLEVVRQLRTLSRDVKILVLSVYDEAIYAERAIRAGALGYVQKRDATDHLIAAIRQVLRGNVYLSVGASERMLHKMVHTGDRKNAANAAPLSNREVEVLGLIAEGYGSQDIADRLGISVKTVNTHRENIKKKLSLRRGSELTRYAASWHEEMVRDSANPSSKRA